MRELSKKCKDARIQNRYLALHALSIGKSVELIAEIFCVDRATLYNWIVKWREERSLEDIPRSGRPNSLTEEQKQEIRNLIEENDPKKHGINASSWDTKEFMCYFARNGIIASRETIRTALIGMGAKYVKATLKYAEADINAQREFARKFFMDAEQNRDNALVFFEDEMSAGCSARKGYGWTFGERLIVKAPQKKKKRVNCFGAVNPFSGEITEMSSVKAKAGAFIQFLQSKLLDRHPKKRMIIYVDRGPVHRAVKVREFLKKNPRLRLEFIPPYSPDLNPQEQWWGYKRQKFLNNTSFRSQRHIALAMASFVRNTEPETVMSVCSLEPLENLLR
ncbi:MAG: IS630 family transposase [Nanoarchaeota archaeon]